MRLKGLLVCPSVELLNGVERTAIARVSRMIFAAKGLFEKDVQRMAVLP